MIAFLLILELLAWLVFCYGLMSMAEYVAHRWPMHSKRFSRRFPVVQNVFVRHAVLHHGRFFKKFDHDPDPAANHVNIDMSPWDNLALGAPLWLPLLVVRPLSGIVLMATIVAHAFVWTAIHREMHNPQKRWFSKTGVYGWLRAYHQTHHDHPNSNYNVVCPLADFVFRTYRRKS